MMEDFLLIYVKKYLSFKVHLRFVFYDVAIGGIKMDKENIINVMKRYELKYILNKEQLHYFKKNILSHMKVDKYGLTTISSLYYDTPNYNIISRSIEKPNYKEKIRLRSYGLASKDSKVYLEIKRKSESVVYKRRIVTKEDTANKFFVNEEELENSQIAKELVAFKEKYVTLEPKYLIIYDRIAYYQDDSDVRITLDMNPRYRMNDLNLHTSTEGTPLLNEGEAILEIKVQHSIPLWLVAILTQGKIYQSSFSKVGEAHKKEMANRYNYQLRHHHETSYQLEGGYQYGFTI